MIYLVLLILGLVSALAERFIKKHNGFLWGYAFAYSIVYFWAVSVIRAITSNPREYLSYSFSDKGMGAYIKICIFATAIYAVITLIQFLIAKIKPDMKHLTENIITRFSAVFILMYSLYVILIGWPNIMTVVVMGVISAIVSLICVLIQKKDADKEKKEKDKLDLACLIVALVTFDLLFILAGPTELMAYNAGDFVYSYADVVLYLFMGAVFVSFFAVVLIYRYASKITVRLYSAVIMLYCILCYLQSMFLNGKMMLVDGGKQRWDGKQSIINITVWIVIFIALIILSYKTKIGRKIILAACGYIAAIQMITLIFMLMTAGDLRTTNKHLTQESIFDLSKGDNVIVFILDAYDVQMLKTVYEDDPDYLEPLHDFIYFDNMTSRYPMTDGSLPYLLTGANLDDPLIEEDQDIWYEQAHFLDDIKEAGYDIRILTSDEYVKKIPEGIIDNYSEDNYCRIDCEKILELFTRCMRYKCLPFVVKNKYGYEAYDTTNVITDTNIYVYGTDPEIDDMILDYGVSADRFDKAFRIYHLYGAHSPYYLNENADRDYGSNAISQWRGSLKIVYDFIDCLKEEGIYDNTTLIIMADHGFNNTQRASVREEGIEFDEDRSNPIFFIKKKGMTGSVLQTDSRETSHDKFFDTIYESMDIPLQYYGTVFE